MKFDKRKYDQDDVVILKPNRDVGSMEEVVSAFEKYAGKPVTIKKIASDGYIVKEVQKIQYQYGIILKEDDFEGYADPDMPIKKELKNYYVDFKIPMKCLNAVENMNLSYLNGKYDACVGRDSENVRICQILTRKLKCNPLLVGRAGVGKSAIVEALAGNLVEVKRQSLTTKALQKFPLVNKAIFNVSLTSMIAGTKYRGDFEEKLQFLIDWAKDNENIILFIDEIHMIVGMNDNGNEGTASMAQLLKGYLSRGDISVIGATTEKEAEIIYKDKALARRFSTVAVNELSSKEMLKVLPTIAKTYSEYHNLTISEEVMEKTLEYCDMAFDEDRVYPDKLIDVIDETMARVRLESMGKKVSVGIGEIKKTIKFQTGFIISDEQTT